MAEMDEVIVGCVLCMKENETTGRLRLLLVTPDGRGKGVGTKFVQRVSNLQSPKDTLS
jgi:N-acetylglutamate synthase-like GNAT family acetyltransferase